MGRVALERGSRWMGGEDSFPRTHSPNSIPTGTIAYQINNVDKASLPTFLGLATELSHSEPALCLGCWIGL